MRSKTKYTRRIQNLTIGEGAVVGARAAVLKDVEA